VTFGSPAGIRHVYSYRFLDRSIAVPIVLRSSATEIDLVATIDTGASHCIFETAYANELNLDLTSGVLKRFRTTNSTFEAFGHEVHIEVLGVLNYSLVYFFAEPSIVKNVLGHAGWLDRVRLGLVDYDSLLYLDAYDQAPE
jgi:hypothetical protein